MLPNNSEYDIQKTEYFNKLYKKFINGELNMSSPNDFYFIIFENEAIDQDEVESFFSGFDGFSIESIDTLLSFTTKRSNNQRTATFYNEFGFLTAQLASSDITLFRDRVLQTTTRGLIIPSNALFSIPQIPKIQSGNAPNITISSQFTGKNVKIAVLDSGFDCNHPHFKPLITKNNSFNFIDLNYKIQDNFGHGTHCVGIACGDTDPNNIKYGIARDSTPYIGKILDDKGHGDEVYLTRGLYWCLKKNCDIISLSLGGRKEDDLYNPAIQRIIYRLYQNDILTFAAAGNNSFRKRNSYWHISTPANCPHAISIGGINHINNQIYNRSNRAIGFQFMSFVGPAVDIYSTWSSTAIPKQNYKRLSGTSMSTPYVAGIAALLREQQMTTHSPIPLYTLIQQRASKPNGWMVQDAGNGLP